MPKPTTRILLAVLLAATSSAFAADPAPPAAIKPAGGGVAYSLDQFGSVTSAAEAQKAFEAACKQIQAAGGGVLTIPVNTEPNWKPLNIYQEEFRTPEAPAPAKSWKEGPGVTVIDPRGKSVNVMPSPITGLKMSRVLQLPDGQSLPHWNYNPMLTFENIVARGSTSYHDWVQEDVAAGKDAKFYVATIRGLFPGMFINANAWSTVDRLYVKSLGYEKETNRWFIVADCEKDFKKGTILSNKNHVNILKLDTYSHNENQTFDICLWRHNYSQGDNYLVDARFKYMGDVHSTAGDENGVIYAAFVEPETATFRSKVVAWNPATAELQIEGNPSADTLGSGRPIINLNPKKQITAGSVNIVRPGDWTMTNLRPTVDPIYKGKTYPTVVEKNKIDIPSLKVGGLIRFSADAPITKDVIGRYFAVDMPDEVEKANKRLRWYLICDLVINTDGTKDIKIIRHWWGAKQASSPTLYNIDNYSFDGHEKPLKYIIAPGVNTYDVSEGLPKLGGHKGIIRLSPSPFVGTDVDFAPGDPIEQALGPDPFHPVPFRSWTWDAVPGNFPAAVFDIANYGTLRGSVMNVRSDASSLEKRLAGYYHGPAYNILFDLAAPANDGIVFRADVTNSAIFFMQPNERAQPIRWGYDKGAKEAEMSVSPKDGTMSITATSVAVPGGLSKVGGISGSDVKANNLRGLEQAVKAGQKEIVVKFANAEADAAYAPFVETNWMTMHVVSKRTAEGFTVEFSQAPAADTVMHWLIVR
jgi:hypothetical protein